MTMDNKDFKIKFRGVRGSYPVVNPKFKEYGGNTSCVEVNINGHLIILDAGTGIIPLGEELTRISHIDETVEKPKTITVLLSHLHQDHIQGLNFFAPINVPDFKISIFGLATPESTLLDDLKELVWGKSFPVNFSDLPSKIRVQNALENKKIIINDDMEFASQGGEEQGGNDIVITCMKSNSHPQNGVMVYKISCGGKSLVYATDKESYVGSDKRMALFARKADVLIHDSQYTSEDYLSLTSSKQGFGHSTYDMAVETAQVSQIKQLIFFHYAPNYDDNKLSKIENTYSVKYPNTVCSKEGLEICL